MRPWAPVPWSSSAGWPAAPTSSSTTTAMSRPVWGSAWTDTGRIFTREDGRDLTPDWVSTHFERLTLWADLPPIRLHDLRHGAATLSLAAGNDMKTTSTMLRHSSISITADLYTAVLPDVARAAAEASAALVPRTVTVGESFRTNGLRGVGSDRH
ncbi:tyrosine-type recombinase/integrase [Nonomuraea polychroma]|uniref:tyrosine-type recombinase/integrase n=1 Tax=Nonomuraea polychroma TaxID=46176 RepID=UPI000FDD78B5